MGNSKGSFTVKSTWSIIIQGEKNPRGYELLREKGIPFKINFFIWRVWLRRIATNDNLGRIKINIVLRCHYCDTDAIIVIPMLRRL